MNNADTTDTRSYKRAEAQRVGEMADGELIVFNNGTFSDTDARDLALAEIRRRGLSRDGLYTDAARRAAAAWVSTR